MKTMNENEQAFNIKFVMEVKKYPCLYNYELSEYSRRDITEAAWSNVGKAMNMEGSACKEKWKNLRSVYVRYAKPFTSRYGPKKSKRYYLTDAMKFILPFVKCLTPFPSDYIPENDSQHEHDDSTTELELDRKSFPTQLDNQPTTTSTSHATGHKDNEALNAFAHQLLEYHPSTSSAPQARGTKRKMPLNEVDRAFIQLCEGYAQAKQEDHYRKMFLLSLLDEVNEMSDEQMKVFKRKVLGLIDEIMSS